MNKNILIGIVVVALVGAGGWYMASQPKATKPTDTAIPETSPTTSTAVTEPTSGTSSASGTTETSVKTFTVVGEGFTFAPNKITVKKGDTVRIVFENKEGFHDFVIDEFDAKTKQIQAGASETIEFVADKAGTFEYYCSVGKHRQMGMVGSLVVEE